MFDTNRTSQSINIFLRIRFINSFPSIFHYFPLEITVHMRAELRNLQVADSQPLIKIILLLSGVLYLAEVDARYLLLFLGILPEHFFHLQCGHRDDSIAITGSGKSLQ